jgi:hypothetical protein
MKAKRLKELTEPLFKFDESKPLEKDTLPVSQLLERQVRPTKTGITTTDLCFKSGMGTPMFSRRGQSTIPAKAVFQEKRPEDRGDMQRTNKKGYDEY